MKLLIMCLCSFAALAAGQRITTIQLDGVQYFVSRMNPYSPELNYFLAYQYCRSLGLQLASFETKEKAESMTQYLQNAGYSKYDFWTSGNRLGTGMFLWMSTGLPFNATFDYFENSKDAVQAGLLDPVDHNSNTSPQRTARDSSSGLEKGCVKLQAPSLRWAPEDCSAVKDFICEQTRCYYYNYGSIPVSSAQGRPITITTTTTAPLPLSSTTTAPIISTTLPPLVSSSVAPSSPEKDVNEKHTETPEINQEEKEKSEEPLPPQHNHLEEEGAEEEDGHQHHDDVTLPKEHDTPNEENNTTEDKHAENDDEKIEATTTVEQRLKKISEEIEKYSTSESDADIGRQSFFSLSDLIKTLRPTDKKIPQIDSDYSNTMRVLGESASIISAGGSGDVTQKLTR